MADRRAADDVKATAGLVVMFERVTAQASRFVRIDTLAFGLPGIAIRECRERVDEPLQRFALRRMRAQLAARAASRDRGTPRDVQLL